MECLKMYYSTAPPFSTLINQERINQVAVRETFLQRKMALERTTYLTNHSNQI